MLMTWIAKSSKVLLQPQTLRLYATISSLISSLNFSVTHTTSLFHMHSTTVQEIQIKLVSLREDSCIFLLISATTSEKQQEEI